jgi:hypothetical protein
MKVKPGAWHMFNTHRTKFGRRNKLCHAKLPKTWQTRLAQNHATNHVEFAHMIYNQYNCLHNHKREV